MEKSHLYMNFVKKTISSSELLSQNFFMSAKIAAKNAMISGIYSGEGQ